MPTFCDLCQLPLSAGTPHKNTARVFVHEGRKYIFCSEPCQWIFLREPERYANHKDMVKRVLSGEAPAQLPNLLTEYFNSPQIHGAKMFIMVITSGSELESLRRLAAEMTLMPIPLYGFLQGDTVGLLILAEEGETLQALARKLQAAASLRVASRDQVQVVHNDKTMDPAMTVAQAGLQAFDRFDVISG